MATYFKSIDQQRSIKYYLQGIEESINTDDYLSFYFSIKPVAFFCHDFGAEGAAILAEKIYEVANKFSYGKHLLDPAEAKFNSLLDAVVGFWTVDRNRAKKIIQEAGEEYVTQIKKAIKKMTPGITLAGICSKLDEIGKGEAGIEICRVLLDCLPEANRLEVADSLIENAAEYLCEGEEPFFFNFCVTQKRL